jgi:hypothetical protein
VFAALGRATAWLGPAGNGTRAKLVLNNWLADLTETTAETLGLARQLGLDPGAIVDLLESTPLGSPYAVQKARSMLAGDFAPAFALKHALKDGTWRHRPHGRAAPGSPAPKRCCPAGAAPPPAATRTTTWPRSTPLPDRPCAWVSVRRLRRLRRRRSIADRPARPCR